MIQYYLYIDNRCSHLRHGPVLFKQTDDMGEHCKFRLLWDTYPNYITQMYTLLISIEFTLMQLFLSPRTTAGSRQSS